MWNKIYLFDIVLFFIRERINLLDSEGKQIDYVRYPIEEGITKNRLKTFLVWIHFFNQKNLVFKEDQLRGMDRKFGEIYGNQAIIQTTRIQVWESSV